MHLTSSIVFAAVWLGDCQKMTINTPFKNWIGIKLTVSWVQKSVRLTPLLYFTFYGKTQAQSPWWVMIQNLCAITTIKIFIFNMETPTCANPVHVSITMSIVYMWEPFY